MNDFDLKIDRILDLTNAQDFQEFLNKLEGFPGIPLVPKENVKKSLTTFIRYFPRKEWLKIYSGGIMAAQITQKGSEGFHAILDLLPLSYGLLILEQQEGFQCLLKKLSNPSQFLDTVFEVKCILYCLQRAPGANVVLEPKYNSKRPDFSLEIDGTLIVFECKRERPFQAKHAKRFSEIAHKLMSDLKPLADRSIRIEVRILSPLKGNIEDTLSQFIEEIKLKWQNITSKLPYYEKHHLFEIFIATKEHPLRFEDSKLRISEITVGTEPTPIDPRRGNILICAYPISKYREKKVRELFTEAKGQIPRSLKGIIILDVSDPQIAIKVAKERLSIRENSHLAAVLINPLHAPYLVWRNEDEDMALKRFPDFTQRVGNS